MTMHDQTRNIRPANPGPGWSLLAAALLGLLAGCTSEPDFRLNAVHKRTIEKEQLDGAVIPESQVTDIGNLVTALFGTPAEPEFPVLPGDNPVVDPQLLKLAAGPVASDRTGRHSGLYREHCAHCHGLTGDGAGPTAAFLNPYPRDFRLGKFKFKSTRMYRPPTDADLRRILENGIPGTAMPSFRLLDDEELNALVDYVKYLSIRGQTERALLEETAQLDPDESLWAARGTVSDEEFDDQLGQILEDIVLPVIEKWQEPDSNITMVPPLPDDWDTRQQTWAPAGAELFFGKANCVQCHGPTGLGDGQTRNYDDWTNEWLKRAKVDEGNPAEVAEFMQLGALPPRKLRPRNLGDGVFRGGSRPSDLYRRIADGIEGSSMPAAGGLQPQEIWLLVAYVLELGFAEQEGQKGYDR